MTKGTSLALLPRERTGLVEVRTGALAPAVRDGMQDLLVAYPPHPGEDSADRVRLVRIWARETAEFEPEIIAEALHSLLRNNPRNPFRPSVQDIVGNCLAARSRWTQRITHYYLSEADDPPAAWCARLTSDALRYRLEELRRRYDSGAGGPEPSPYRAVTDTEYCGWRMAKEIGRRLGQWPKELLAEFGVLSGSAFERIQAIADAEEEARRQREESELQAHRAREAEARRESDRRSQLEQEARAAAMGRPDVKAAKDTADAAYRRNRVSADAEHAHDKFVALWRPALQEERQTRGLAS